MKVGTICRLKVDCLDNKAGTLGVVYFDYRNGFQVIFENGNYDGFSRERKMPKLSQMKDSKTEIDYFLEEVGVESSLTAYHFQNAMQVSEDYRGGLFNIAWSENWKNFAKGATSVSNKQQATTPTLLDCCKRYIRMQEEVNKEMEKKPTGTLYWMMKEAVAEYLRK